MQCPGNCMAYLLQEHSLILCLAAPVVQYEVSIKIFFQVMAGSLTRRAHLGTPRILAQCAVST
jgi:hypothetical protein